MSATPPSRKLALVTGASAGIGAAFARALSAEGHDVAMVARRLDRLEALAAELRAADGTAPIAICADLSKPDAHAPIMDALQGRTVDLLVNNAGLSIPGPFATSSWQAQRDCLMTLVMAVADLTHAVLPGMLAKGGGRIITVSSIVALSQGGPGHTVYPAAKAFAHKFMLSLDAEVRPRGVVCTSVLPGTTSSEFREANDIHLRAGGLADRFVTSPDEVARAALAANAAGRVMAVVGAHNKMAALAMKYAPDSLVRWLGRRMS